MFVVYSKKSKTILEQIFQKLGWGRNSRINYVEHFPKQNYFDFMCLNDITVFRNGSIPVEIELYFIDAKEMQDFRKKGLIKNRTYCHVIDYFSTNLHCAV